MVIPKDAQGARGCRMVLVLDGLTQIFVVTEWRIASPTVRMTLIISESLPFCKHLLNFVQWDVLLDLLIESLHELLCAEILDAMHTRNPKIVGRCVWIDQS